MIDFTITAYVKLLQALKQTQIPFYTFREYVSIKPEEFIILRHDVDRLPSNSLRVAKIEALMGLKGSYYFRINKNSFNKEIITEIFQMGHEIGYHYEDMTFAKKKISQKGYNQKLNKKELERIITDLGIESFRRNLEELRKIVTIETICMHGSPMSNWDSRLLWKDFDYKNFAIIGEPYIDIDFNESLYLTDTGRRWDGSAVSVRDKAINKGQKAAFGEQLTAYYWVVKPINGSLINMSQRSKDFQKMYSFHSTNDIIRALNEDRFPNRAMITFHPQRWTDKTFPWLKELIFQNAKNVIKFYLVKSS